MARRIRIQYPGALYHVTSRGNRRAPIFIDDRDHLIWLDLLGKMVEHHRIVVHSYVQMPNHYHLLAETPEGNLSAGIHFLNGHYAQHFNKRRQLSGHVFQGRFYAEPIEHQAHLLALARYLALNPVRAELVESPENWRWSSYAGLSGGLPSQACVHDAWLLSQFAGADRHARLDAYRAFVAQGMGMEHPLKCRYEAKGRSLINSSGILEAESSGKYTVREIAERFSVSERTVYRIIRSP
jgi:REP element-mobilizing transposase RayT